MNQKEYIVDELNIGKRLDLFLNEKFEDKSRSYIQKLIENENVKINDKSKKQL